MAKLLAIDTAGTYCSIALLNDQQIFKEFNSLPRQQAEIILPYIERLLVQAKISLQALDAIAIAVGPGSFTGLRVGIAVTQGLTLALSLPIIPLSTLQILAQTAYQQFNVTHVIATLDARMSEIYAAAFVLNNGFMQPVSSEMVGKPHDLIINEKHINWHVIGAGGEIFAREFTQLFSSTINEQYQQLLPSAEAMLMLAENKFIKNDTITVEQLTPVYLRDKVTQD